MQLQTFVILGMAEIAFYTKRKKQFDHYFVENGFCRNYRPIIDRSLDVWVKQMRSKLDTSHFEVIEYI